MGCQAGDGVQGLARWNKHLVVKFFCMSCTFTSRLLLAIIAVIGWIMPVPEALIGSDRPRCAGGAGYDVFRPGCPSRLSDLISRLTLVVLIIT